MKALFSRRPSPALVVACIALFVALGPAAYATHEVINSSDVVDNSLLGVDVKGTAGTASTRAVNGSLTGADISGQPANAALGQPFVPGSLTGFDVADGSLKLADHGANSVDASKIVNDASGADNVNATKLDGLDSTQMSPAMGVDRTADLPLTEEDQTVLSASIATARDAVLLVSAAVNVGGFGTNTVDFACSLSFDGSTSSVEYVSFFETQSTLPVVGAQGVGAGAHTVELRCRGGATVLNAAMNVSAHV
jgi:hypothetical protein